MNIWLDIANQVSNNIQNGLSDNKTVEDTIYELTYSSNNKNAILFATANAIKDTSVAETLEVPEGVNSDNATATNTNGVSAWDPRLGRVDGFLSPGTDMNAGDSKNHPIIVPFASETAASAYFNMVFSVEKAVAQTLEGQEGVKGKEHVGESAYKVAKLKKDNEDLLPQIQKDSKYYGVASIMNPYTLTKLCGGINVISSEGAALANEVRLYDIRDQRRFYDMSVSDGTDFTTINNPTTTNIIRWSNNDPWGRTPYSFQDFVFCKWWNKIPNNRLITLRKYHAPVFDNLQFPSMVNSDGSPQNLPFAPIATVLTYFGNDTGNTLTSLLSFTAGTKWKEIKAEIHEVTGNTGSDPHAVIDDMFTNGGGFTGAESNILKSVLNSANWVTGKMFSFGKFCGLLDPDGYNINKDQAVFNQVNQTNIDPTEQLYSNKIVGPVNRIDTTKARDAGIVFDQKFSIVCEYVSRPIGGVNTKAAMLDIISNCMEIAAVDAAFWGGGYKWMVEPKMYPFKNNKLKNTVMDDLYQGKIFGKDGALAHTVEGVKSFGTKNGSGSFDWNNVLDNIKVFMGQSFGALGNMLSSVSSAIFGEGNSLSSLIDKGTDMVSTDQQQKEGTSKLNNLLGNVNDMWRSKVIQKSVMPAINNMKALLTGEPVGNWHLVIGNPLNPIMTVGNLICTDMKFECSDELGPDDFPMEIKVTYQLEHGMPREKSSIQSMFNRGNGKIYDLPDYIRASSDYETKVDNYTGGNGNGWYKPKFMNNTAMAGQGGGIGGYKTYKISPPKELKTNENTDCTIITKFTPVDPDQATSNVQGNISFFGSTGSSRAWIRGTSATRKLMN